MENGRETGCGASFIRRRQERRRISPLLPPRDNQLVKMDPVIERFIEGLEKLNLREKIEEMYLFGSRARGTEMPDSDYDLLIVVNGNSKTNKRSGAIYCTNKEFREKIYDLVVEIFLETGKDISLKIFKNEEFKRVCKMETPFTQNVLKEGIKIG